MAEENIVQQAIYRAIVEPSFANNVFSQLTFNDDTFGDYKDVAIAVRNHYRKYDTPMSGTALVNDLVKKAKTQRKFNDDTQSKIEDAVAEVTTLSKTDNFSNDQEIKDQVDKWSRNVVATGVLMKAISNGSRDIGSDDTLEELLDGLNKALTIGSTSTDAETISLLDPNSVDDVLDLLSEVKQDTVPLHWEALDDLMDGGMAAGEMGMVVAKSGNGKTTALVNMAKQYAVKSKKNVMYIALEERTQRMILRLFRLISNQSQRDIYDEDGVPNIVKLKAQMNALSQAHEQGKIGNIDVVKSTPQTVTPKMIEQFLQEYMLKHGHYPDVIFLDYPDLMLNPHDGQVNEYRGMGMLYEDLRKIAGQYNLIMWVASQANRSAGYEEVVDSSRTIEGSKQKLNTVEVALSINQTDEEFQAGFIRLHVDKVRNPKDGAYSKMLYFKVNTKAVSFEDESPSDFEAHQQVLASSKNDKFGEYKKPSNAQSNEEAKKKIAEVNSKIINIV